MDRYDVLIVGAGHGGAQAARALRQQKYAGSVALLGDEPDPPYERPPLSKEYFAGEKSFDRILICEPAAWGDRKVTLLLSRRVESVDAGAQTVTCADGSKIAYGTLIWAAGGRPRPLPCEGHQLPGVHTLRSRADVDAIKQGLQCAQHVVVIGGGYIGLEAAAVLRAAGKNVTVLEALDRVLARVTGPTLSRFYEQQHRAHGVELRLNAKVQSIVEKNGRAAGVRFDNGAMIPAEMVIVGIGITPAVEPLLATGAAGGNGVEVDEYCRTSLPHVFAVGDCAMHANSFAGQHIRIESVQNAMDQASAVAKTIAGNPTVYHAVPWFWSNQYDLRLQTVGISSGHDQVIVRGNPDSRSFSVIYLKTGRIAALDCVNAAKDYMQGRALIVKGASASVEQLADCSVELKSLVPAVPA